MQVGCRDPLPALEKMSTKQPKRKVLFVLPSLEGGGAERVFISLANFFSTDESVELHLALMFPSFDFSLPSNVVVHSLTSYRGGKKAVRDVLQVGAVWQLRKLLKKIDPDVCIGFLLRANLVLLAAASTIGMWKRVLLTEHGYAAAPVKSLRSRFLLALNLLSYRSAWHTICVSEGLRGYLIARGVRPDRVETILNPVDIDEISQHALQATCPPEMIRIDGRRKILGVGRLAAQKQFNVLIKTVAEVAKSEPVALYLLGGGPERANLERLAKSLGISELVHFLGFQLFPAAYFAHADVFVLTSEWEGFGLVVAEALAARCPCVAYDCNFGVGEILGRDYRWLIPNGDENALAAGILNALCVSKEELDEVRARGSQRVTAVHIDLIGPQYRMMIDRIANGRV